MEKALDASGSAGGNTYRRQDLDSGTVREVVLEVLKDEIANLQVVNGATEGQTEMLEAAERERYLCIGSVYNLYCVDLTKFKMDDSDNQASYDKLTPSGRCCSDLHPLSKADGVDPTCLVGLGSIKLPGMTYRCLFGGEMVAWREGPVRMDAIADSFAFYRVVPTDCGLSLEEITDVPSMKGGKCVPVVEEIGGKIYVLHGGYVQDFLKHPPEVAFEAFDTAANSWEQLENPPCFPERKYDYYFIMGHVVFGHRLYVTFCYHALLCYDTKEKSWSRPASFGLGFYLPAWCVGDYDFGFRDPGDELHLAIKVSNKKPCLFVASTSGVVFARQELTEILPRKFGPVISTLLPMEKGGKDENCKRFYAVAEYGLKLHVNFIRVVPLPKEMIEKRLHEVYDKLMHPPPPSGRVRVRRSWRSSTLDSSGDEYCSRKPARDAFEDPVIDMELAVVTVEQKYECKLKDVKTMSQLTSPQGPIFFL